MAITNNPRRYFIASAPAFQHARDGHFVGASRHTHGHAEFALQVDVQTRKERTAAAQHYAVGFE